MVLYFTSKLCSYALVCFCVLKLIPYWFYHYSFGSVLIFGRESPCPTTHSHTFAFFFKADLPTYRLLFFWIEFSASFLILPQKSFKYVLNDHIWQPSITFYTGSYFLKPSENVILLYSTLRCSFLSLMPKWLVLLYGWSSFLSRNFSFFSLSSISIHFTIMFLGLEILFSTFFCYEALWIWSFPSPFTWESSWVSFLRIVSFPCLYIFFLSKWEFLNIHFDISITNNIFRLFSLFLLSKCCFCFLFF